MSLDSVFMSPRSGRKTSNFFPSGDANGRYQGSTMTIEGGIDGKIVSNSDMVFRSETDREYSGFGTDKIDTESQGPTGGLEMGYLGELRNGLDGGLNGSLVTGTGVGGCTSYINIGGLSLGLAMGVKGSHSIWSDVPKNGHLFSPFVDQGWPSPVESVGFGELFGTGVSQDLQRKPQGALISNFHRNIYLTRVNNPPFVSQTAKPEKRVRSVSNSQLVVSLPTATREPSQCPMFRDYFLLENNDVNNEDYCSTFYKRNRLGYMFIREPSNSLKVNNSGPRSWVQLKIKFPDTANARKLKVDIKQLPFWKPINVNLKDPSRSKKILRDKRKYNVLKRFNKH